MSQIRCVIFDCDGTLIDSERLCCEALAKVFNRHGANMSTQDALRHFEGGKLADILMSTCERLGLSVSLDTLEPEYRQEVDRLFRRHLKPMEGATEIIARLKAAGIEYCVASNGPREKIERSLFLAGLLPDFHGRIFSAFDANSWKPDPDLIQYSAMNMGFSLDECLYIDDTAKGLEAGLRAGVKTVQLLSRNAQSYSQQVKTIENLKELRGLI
ncbi:haloacid dehalogenase superfamily, subfamily IA, variant 3 with third motif having DD or ED [Vibrio xiamenensis]|uniref:Haloacid dehalogenase superfamily, subfamily IA, variant 3 with third motif having DD or ED n=2 Tax=Vibrio xiamenensis TaxID=861298 RepID=A0A1G7YWN1_9VIBR|nr:haloacid dehalogenase superfamily, subfamily IA, variant 3 with third motif having DD or ED [Vibrio xiamenensis]